MTDRAIFKIYDEVHKAREEMRTYLQELMLAGYDVEFNWHGSQGDIPAQHQIVEVSTEEPGGPVVQVFLHTMIEKEKFLIRLRKSGSPEFWNLADDVEKAMDNISRWVKGDDISATVSLDPGGRYGLNPEALLKLGKIV
jgi:hypothetical protein